jgi:hypothetical protein
MAAGVTVHYFYKTRWGCHDEFVELFERNHWPILREQLNEGRLLDVRRYVPRFHGDGRADWDVLVTITYRDWAALEAHSEAEIAERLFRTRSAIGPRNAVGSRSSKPTGTCRSKIDHCSARRAW